MSSPTRCASPLVPELRQEGKRRCSVYHDGGKPRGHGYLTSATAVFNNEENDRKLIIHIVGLLHPRASGLKEPEPRPRPKEILLVVVAVVCKSYYWTVRI